MRGLVLLMLVGCGRIGFDPLADPDAPSLVTVGHDFGCASLEGRVTCWGKNDEGQLGRGDLILDPAPHLVDGLGGIRHLTAIEGATFAIDRDGLIWSWGHTGDRTLGEDVEVPRTRPGRTPIVAGAVEISGGTGTCARTLDGTTVCWGDADAGQLGIGSAPDYTLPAPGVLTGVSQISIGTDHGCAVTGGQLFCFGSDLHGQLGVDATQATDSCKNIDGVQVPCSIAPIAVPGVIAPHSISAGRIHTCAIFADALVRCWGGNADGALGDGTNNDSITPVIAMGLGPAQQVTSSRHHTCALLVDGSAWCWGDGGEGELGNGVFGNSAVPVRVDIPIALQAIDSEQSAFHTCAVDVDDGVWCWGDNTDGQLGTTGPAQATPIRVPL